MISKEEAARRMFNGEFVGDLIRSQHAAEVLQKIYDSIESDVEDILVFKSNKHGYIDELPQTGRVKPDTTYRVTIEEVKE